jgi:glycosyltransferase involved in cell wall biosynthesis
VKLLHVTHQYRPAIGGSERYMTDLSEELARRGHLVDVFTTRSHDFWTWGNDLPGFERQEGVNVYRFRSLRRRAFTWRLLDFGYAGYRPTRWRRYEPFILAGNGPLSPGLAWAILTRGQSYDLIHIQTLPYAHVVYGYACARRTGRPIVLTPHLHVEEPGTFDIEMFNAVLRGADLVIAVSGREHEYLVARGVADERVLVAGNGVKLEELPRRDPIECRRRLGLPADATILLFLGRKIAYKGLAIVLEAFAALQARYSALWLVAAGPPTDDSISLHQTWNGLPRYLELDAVSEEQKQDLLNACDVLLLPSTAEAFGIVFLEAWAVGKPVIGARAGAIPWVIDDERDGLLVEPGDAAGLAAQVERLIGDPTLAHRLGEAGYQKVRARYTVERIADVVEAAYRRVVRNTQRERP